MLVCFVNNYPMFFIQPFLLLPCILVLKHQLSDTKPNKLCHQTWNFDKNLAISGIYTYVCESMRMLCTWYFGVACAS